jgi:pyridoxamine 5'-phosphate oxidase-like protein
MPDPVNLEGQISDAINSSGLRGALVAVAYVREDGTPSVSFRGSTYIRNAKEVAIWVRKRDEGLATAIAKNPRVALVFFELDGPGARYVSIEGNARTAPELNDEVYAGIIERERDQDPEKKGIAVLVEADKVLGAGADGYFQQAA